MNLIMKPVSLAILALLSSAALTAGAQEQRKPYIVQLIDPPAATYKGGVQGMPATQPAPGEVFDTRSPGVQTYLQYLGTRKENVLNTIGNPTVLHSYDTVVNGFSAMLTQAEVLALKNNPDVIDVQADSARRLDTVSTSDFLGLTAPGGVWSKDVNGFALKGEDVVIGVIDSGIWPENPAFADKVDANGVPTHGAGTQVYGPAPASFKGGCVAGEGFDPAKHCNNKLIGAKYYNEIFVQQQGSKKNWSEFYSPRDSNTGFNGVSSGHGSHGTHTASTAAGNSNAPAIVDGINFGNTSGMAPRARIAAYKVCFTFDDPAADDGTNASNTCYSGDSVKAIDDAVKDGVNVINFSISGSQTSVNDIVEQAFYRASLAGVFVAASAGNSGPGNAVAHVSPWLTTVAASTHDRSFKGNVNLGNSAVYSGASTNPNALSAAPMIRAEDAGMGGGNANLCFSGAPAPGQVLLDPAKVAGKVVVCTRGTNARVDKSLAVLNAGGVGMVLVDNGSGLVAEPHSVPTVHVTSADGAAIKTYAATEGSTAAISKFFSAKVPAPIMAGFSSRGPNQGDSNILKPDLTAPGVDIIAGASASLTPAEHALVASGDMVPPAANVSMQGTSMSSPHVAGLGLLMRQKYPNWTPAAIKSALMTTAYPTLNDGLAGAQNGLLPWAQGAGHVDPNKAIDPGLVYDMGKGDFIAYQCKVNRPAMSTQDCNTYGILDETYNLNLPSITVGTVVGSTTVRRSVTNVGDTNATYNASATLDGFTVTVTPQQLVLAPGQTANFTVKLTANGAAQNVWKFGQLVWNDGPHTVRSPIQARVGKPISAPALLTGDKASGTRLFPVMTGFSGRMTGIKGGMKAPTMGDAVTMTAAPLSSTALRNLCVAGVDTASVKVYNVTVPAGTLVARFALFQKDTNTVDDDHDLGVLTPSNQWGYSGNGGSDENVQIAAPAAGNYRVCVVAYDGEDDNAMTHKLASWVVTPADVGGKFTLAIPGKVVAGTPATVGVSWSGLADNTPYMGGAQFVDTNGVVQATTVVSVNTGSANVPTAESDRYTGKMKE